MYHFKEPTLPPPLPLEKNWGNRLIARLINNHLINRRGCVINCPD